MNCPFKVKTNTVVQKLSWQFLSFCIFLHTVIICISLGHKYLLLDVITNLFQKFCKQIAVNANKISQKITFENANTFYVPKSSMTNWQECFLRRCRILWMWRKDSSGNSLHLWEDLRPSLPKNVLSCNSLWRWQKNLWGLWFWE